MLIVALNGFLGENKPTAPLTRLVSSTLYDLELRDRTQFIEGRGGSGIWNYGKIKKQVLAFQGDVALFIGKSYGAHWCIKLLWALADSEKLFRYKKVGLLTIDPSYVLHKMQKRKRPIPDIPYAHNYHQYGRRSGYLLDLPAENHAISGEHNSLEESPTVRCAIREILAWGSA